MAIKLRHTLPKNIESIEAAVFDVDGTIARDDSLVSKRTITALKALANSGIPIILATGRMAPSTLGLFDQINVPGHVIACNGALAVHTQRSDPVFSSPINKPLYNDILAFSKEHDLEPTVFGVKDHYAEDDGEATRFLTVSNDGIPPIMMNLHDVPEDDRLKFTLYLTTDKAETVAPLLREKFPHAVHTLEEYYEINEPGVTKWAGVESALDNVGVAPENTLGLGDSENDLPWLSKIGLPIAMGNAFDKVKELCHYIVGDNDDDAVASFVETWVRQRQ